LLFCNSNLHTFRSATGKFVMVQARSAPVELARFGPFISRSGNIAAPQQFWLGKEVMSLHRSASKWLVLVAAGAVSAGAGAADMGPTGRGTVSISVTIAPHVAIAPAAALAGAAAKGRALCVESNGFTQFHVALVRQAGAGPQFHEVLHPDPDRAEASDCSSGSALLPPVAAVTAEEQVSRGEPLRLLIVPD
jgi:hypothetical protein